LTQSVFIQYNIKEVSLLRNKEMKYLKKSAEVLIGKAGVQSKSHLSDYTATLVMPTLYSDGSGEDLLGIQVTREHLVHLRNEIDDYLSKTNDNTPASKEVGSVNNFNIKVETGLTEAQVLGVLGQVSQQVRQLLQTKSQQKQAQLVIDPRLVIVNEIRSLESQTLWSAKLRLLSGFKDFSVTDARIELSVIGNSEEEVRAKLNSGFHDLIMACLYPDSSESRIPDIIQENNQPTSGSDESKKADEKDATQFKLKPSYVMSIPIGGGKWEARTRIFNGIDDKLVDLVATAGSEEAAREELDKKFSSFAGPMTNFIKFMSQALQAL
jgi:hypothetical protein